MEQLHIKHSEFNPTCMVKTSLDSKQSKPKLDPQNPTAGLQSVSYHVSQILYEYSSTDQKGNPCKVVAPLAVECPELYSPIGILSKINVQGYETASLFTVFDMTKQDIKSFCSLGKEHSGLDPGFWQVFYKWCMQRVWELRSQIPTVARLPAIEALLGMFAYPLYFARDPVSSQVMVGSNPSKYFNLLCHGQSGSVTRKETLFKAPISDGDVAGKKQFRTIPWKYLQSVEMVFMPIITFKQLYIGGGKVTLQFEITSAVVKHVIPINSSCAQDSTLAEYESNDDVRNTITAQIDVLTRRLVNSRLDETSLQSRDDTMQTSKTQKQNEADNGQKNSNQAANAFFTGSNTSSNRPADDQKQSTNSIQQNNTLPSPLPTSVPNPFANSGLRPISGITPSLSSMMSNSNPTIQAAQ